MPISVTKWPQNNGLNKQETRRKRTERNLAVRIGKKNSGSLDACHGIN